MKKALRKVFSFIGKITGHLSFTWFGVYQPKLPKLLEEEK